MLADGDSVATSGDAYEIDSLIERIERSAAIHEWVTP